MASMWFWWVVVMVGLLMTQAFVLRMYGVPSESMEATLETGDRMLVQQVGSGADTPERGDVVVFSGDPKWGAVDRAELGVVEHSVRAVSSTIGLGPGYGGTLVKRVIGLPGETVSCCDDQGRVLVDGDPLEEPYIHEDFPFSRDELDCSAENTSMRCFGDVELAEGEYFMLGDHRAYSHDSSAGCRGDVSACEAKLVQEEDIVGTVRFLLWPISRFGPIG
jgi:signal peptidase I